MSEILYNPPPEVDDHVPTDKELAEREYQASLAYNFQQMRSEPVKPFEGCPVCKRPRKQRSLYCTNHAYMGGKPPKKPQKPTSNRDAMLRRRYGFDEIVWEAQRVKQAGCCACCYEAFNTQGTEKAPCVDSPQQGVLRALVCWECFKAIAFVRCGQKQLTNAMRYVERAQ